MATGGGEDSDQDLVLPPQYTHLPIRALRVTSRRKVSQFLDLDGNLTVCEVQGHYGDEELDLVNNYNGLAELIGFGYLEIQNMMRCKSPTEELLNMWTQTAANGGPTVKATVGNLWKFLLMMERFDVLTDCRRAILNDCRLYDDNQQMEIEAERYRFEKMEQDPTVTNSEMQVDECMYADVATVKTGESTHYNAFISYCDENEEDRVFVRQLIKDLEADRGLKLFVPGRDDLPGSAYHVITAYLIEKKCDRVVLVMSDSFLKSEVCDFQLKFAHSLAPGARSKKLIPIIRNRKTQIPRILRFLAVCDFSKTDMLDWVVDRLYSAIIAPIGPITYFQDSDMNEYSTYRREFENSIYPQSSRRANLSSSSGVSSALDDTSSVSSGFVSSPSTSSSPSSSTRSSSTEIYQRTRQSKPSNHTAPIVTNKETKSSKSFSLFSSLKRKSKRSSTSTKEDKKPETKVSQSMVVEQAELQSCSHIEMGGQDEPVTSNESIRMTRMAEENSEPDISSSVAAEEGFVKVDYVIDPTYVPAGPPSFQSMELPSIESDVAEAEPKPTPVTLKPGTKPDLPPKPNADRLKSLSRNMNSDKDRQAEPTIHFV